MKKIFVFLLLLVVALTGCAQNQNAEGYYDNNHDKNGRTFVKNKTFGFDDEYSMDRDMSEQNPNFPDFDRNRVNQGSYVEKARTVINNTDEFEPGQVWMNGRRMWVTAYKKGQMSHKEKIDAEARLHKLLIKAIPIYDIEVTVREDRR